MNLNWGDNWNRGSNKVEFIVMSSHCNIPSPFAYSYVISGSNLVVLCWSCILVKQAYHGADLCTGVQWSRLVTVQCLALHGVLSAGKTCVCAAARKKLHRVWNEVWFYKFSWVSTPHPWESNYLFFTKAKII